MLIHTRGVILPPVFEDSSNVCKRIYFENLSVAIEAQVKICSFAENFTFASARQLGHYKPRIILSFGLEVFLCTCMRHHFRVSTAPDWRWVSTLPFYVGGIFSVQSLF